ncbi:MAG: hypothetical protein AAB535_01440 [Patescibacteria group bacterium]
MYKRKSINFKFKDVLAKPYHLSETNRITRVYRKLPTGEISAIICISLDCYFNRKWRTILYYDTVHGYLHRHERLSLKDMSETISTQNVKKKGSQNQLMNWVIRDISRNYISYKIKFLQNSGCSKSEIVTTIY